MKRIIFTLLLASLFAFNMQAQDNPKEKDVYVNVDQMPEYPGGIDSLNSFIFKNVEYPPEAVKNKIQGKVFVGFVIDESGNVTNTKIVRGVDPLLDNEAIRIVGKLKKWTPGKNNGKIVKVEYVLPINFALQ